MNAYVFGSPGYEVACEDCGTDAVGQLGIFSTGNLGVYPYGAAQGSEANDPYFSLCSLDSMTNTLTVSLDSLIAGIDYIPENLNGTWYFQGLSDGET
jgi:hypothetical protein